MRTLLAFCTSDSSELGKHLICEPEDQKLEGRSGGAISQNIKRTLVCTHLDELFKGIASQISSAEYIRYCEVGTTS